jgi:hypothetical protein
MKVIVLVALICLFMAAQSEQPASVLPDPLTMADGTRVSTAAQWRDIRRPELLELFTREMYGMVPPRNSRHQFLG